MAEANHLKTLSDLGKWINGGGKFKLAASAEFIERPDALPAFQNAYGFKLNQDQLLSTAGGDTAVTIKAAAEQTSGVNAAMAYGTDGPVAALGLQTGGSERRTADLRTGADRARSGAEGARQSA